MLIEFKKICIRLLETNKTKRYSVIFPQRVGSNYYTLSIVMFCFQLKIVKYRNQNKGRKALGNIDKDS